MNDKVMDTTTQELFTEELRLLSEAVENLDFLANATYEGLEESTKKTLAELKAGLDTLKADYRQACDEAKKAADGSLIGVDEAVKKLGDLKTKTFTELKAKADEIKTALEALKASSITDIEATATKAKEELLKLPTVNGFKDEVLEEVRKESSSLGGGLGVDGMLYVINNEALLLDKGLKAY